MFSLPRFIFIIIYYYYFYFSLSLFSLSPLISPLPLVLSPHPSLSPSPSAPSLLITTTAVLRSFHDRPVHAAPATAALLLRRTPAPLDHPLSPLAELLRRCSSSAPHDPHFLLPTPAATPRTIPPPLLVVPASSAAAPLSSSPTTPTSASPSLLLHRKPSALTPDQPSRRQLRPRPRLRPKPDHRLNRCRQAFGSNPDPTQRQPRQPPPRSSSTYAGSPPTPVAAQLTHRRPSPLLANTFPGTSHNPAITQTVPSVANRTPHDHEPARGSSLLVVVVSHRTQQLCVEGLRRCTNSSLAVSSHSWLVAARYHPRP